MLIQVARGLFSRRNSRDAGVVLIAARGDGACDEAAIAMVEETAAIVEDYKGTLVRT